MAGILLLAAQGCTILRTEDIEIEKDDETNGSAEVDTDESSDEPDTEEEQTELTELPETEYESMESLGDAETVESLPADPVDALVSVSIIGGHTSFYVYSEGMTFYVERTTVDSEISKTYYVGELTLPEGYTDGKITDGYSGGGSGEAILVVSALKDGEDVKLAYFFDCFSSFLEPADIYEDTERIE